MIEERCFNRDKRKHFSRDETFHDVFVNSITSPCGITVKEKVDSVENFKKTKITSTKPDDPEAGIPSVMINLEHTEADDGRNRRNVSMIEERCFNRDKRKLFSRDETFHDASYNSITSPCGITVKEKVDSVENIKETKIMSAKPDEPEILAIEKKREAEDPRKFRCETGKDQIENQIHKEVLSTNDANLGELIDTRQQGNLESHDMKNKSLVENNEIDGLPVGEFKSGNQHLRSRHTRPQIGNSANRKKKEGRTKILLPSRKICMSLFLVLSSNIMICAEKKGKHEH